LQGEAFFQAARNEKLPLVVTAGELKVKVLGTTFNVNAYPETGSVDVVLEEGSVEIVNAGGKSFRYLLKPGELARFDRNNRQMLISEINPAKFTAWKDGIINIYDQTMKTGETA
jgi:ferric-dicitrate binding protein FerR (iron transport regulator)